MYNKTCCVDSDCNEKWPTEDAETFKLAQVVRLGKLKIPQQQEILVTLSAQIDIFTLNTATSKRDPFDPVNYYGNIGGTKAMAGIDVDLVAVSLNSTGQEVEHYCAPGKVTMASRMVEVRLSSRLLEVVTCLLNNFSFYP